MPRSVHEPRAAHFVAPVATRRLVVALLALAAFSASGASAGESASSPMPAETLVSEVLAANPGLAAMRAAADAAATRVEPAGALPDPRLRITTAPRTFDGFRTPAGRERHITGIADLSQDVPWPGTLGLREEVAQQEAAATVDKIASIRLRLEAATRRHYAQWRYVHEALEINAANQGLVDELRRVAEKRYAAGLVRQQDVIQAEVELQRLKNQAIGFQRLKAVVRARINALLNRDAYHQLAPPAAPAAPADPRAIPSYAELRDRALNKHPELAALNKQIAANEGREGLANKAFYPDLRLIVRSNGYRPASETRSEIGLSINLPLDRSKRHAALDAATADSARLRYELEDTRTRLLADLAQARADAQQAADTIALYEAELIPRTTENLSAARSEYGAGGGAFLDVITAEQIKLDAELELERARADYSAALAELERWSGGALPAASATKANADHP